MQDFILKQQRQIAMKIENRLPFLRFFSSDIRQIETLTQEILNRWNEMESPRFLSLYQQTEALESRVRNMMESYS